MAHQVLAALGQHRMATTAQLHTMLFAHRRNQNAVSKILTPLRLKKLVDFVVPPGSSRTRAWYLTSEGARLVRDWPQLRGRPPYPITSRTAASLRTAHTLTAVRAHLSFTEQARQTGGEHGAWDWTPEVSHSLGDGDRLIADAVMHYTQVRSRQRLKLRAFIEIDRTTMSGERLAAKLIEYARLWSYEPSSTGRQRQQVPLWSGPHWQRWYPVFPRLLFILTGASPRSLRNRISDLEAMTGHHPLVAAMAKQVPLGAAVLEDLETGGSGASVWFPLNGGDPRPWTEL
ncbi:replication-relaxation family protein [Streptomyces sp. NPDC002952]|uniref:replication-relaxation family protein n=1 Tax=Streptomyces sp. NPDC002952 TaxID=3364673 RepID=UPI003686AD6D